MYGSRIQTTFLLNYNLGIWRGTLTNTLKADIAKALQMLQIYMGGDEHLTPGVLC